MLNLLALYNKHINGQKTNTVVAAVVCLGVLQGLGVVEIPTTMWSLLGAAGLAFLRDGVKKIEAVVRDTARVLESEEDESR